MVVVTLHIRGSLSAELLCIVAAQTEWDVLDLKWELALTLAGETSPVSISLVRMDPRWARLLRDLRLGRADLRGAEAAVGISSATIEPMPVATEKLQCCARAETISEAGSLQVTSPTAMATAPERPEPDVEATPPEPAPGSGPDRSGIAPAVGSGCVPPPPRPRRSSAAAVAASVTLRGGCRRMPPGPTCLPRAQRTAERLRASPTECMAVKGKVCLQCGSRPRVRC
mmetsp:Transcript_119506/g.333405  ORF Transcript_119506/g.333405 Transcript_119506/m.333405 type:complete len:227 (-) Transcript_119506:212-892(-)